MFQFVSKIKIPPVSGGIFGKEGEGMKKVYIKPHVRVCNLSAGLWSGNPPTPLTGCSILLFTDDIIP
jgi:hypothetical protein